MRMKGLAWLAALVLLLCAVGGAAASMTIDFEVREAYAVDGDLCFVLYTTSPDIISVDSMSALMDGQTLDTLRIDTLPKSELGTSYLILLDNAASLHKSYQWPQATDVVAQLLSRLPANANAAVITARQALALEPIALTSDQGALQTTLQAIKLASDKDPECSIRRAVSKAPDLLANASGVNARQALIVVSDGVEDAADGITESELMTTLADKRCIIHTITLMQNGDANADRAIEMGSWARATKGQTLRLPYKATYNRKSESADAAMQTTALAAELANGEQGQFVVRCAMPAGYQAESAAGLLRIKVRYDRFEYSSKNPFEVSRDVLAALQVKAAAPLATDAPAQAIVTAPPAEPTEIVATPTSVAQAVTVPPSSGDVIVTEPGVDDSIGLGPIEPTETAILEPTDSGAEQIVNGGIVQGEDTGFFERVKGFALDVWEKVQKPLWFDLPMWAYIAAGLAALILLIVLLSVGAHRRKKRRQTQAQDAWEQKQREWSEQSFDVPSESGTLQQHTIGPADLKTESTDGRTMGPMDLEGGSGQMRYILTWLNGPKVEQFLFMSAGPVVIGRSREKADWVFAESKRMSGRHCVLERVGDAVYVTDLNSTNGTRIGTQALKGRAELSQDAVIEVGDYTFRFNWMDA